MKKALLALALLASTAVMAQDVGVSRTPLGSGQPGQGGLENAQKWDNNIYHAPQYMPGHPTAATLYPRVVDVPCVQTTTGLSCKGYNWMPEMGRGEYLMIRPIIQVENKPQVITEMHVIQKETVREVLVEVPVKKKKE